MQLTYEDLRNCARLAKALEDSTERIQRLRSMLERTTTRARETPGAGAFADRMAESIARLDEWETECIYRSDAYLEHAFLVDQEIERLEDDRHRRVLRLRYLDGLLWEEIAEKMHYSIQWCKHLHDTALEKLGVT